MEHSTIITRFLDDTGRITKLPSKFQMRIKILEYLASKMDFDCVYSEQQINEICSRWHTFGDYFLLRRELVDNGLLSRERDGSRYWRTKDNSHITEDE